jgi:hypothetical protein
MRYSAAFMLGCPITEEPQEIDVNFSVDEAPADRLEF